MYTPLDIENKKFAKQMMNGYSVDEVDEFLDELTVDYEKLYKESNEDKIKKVAQQQAEQMIQEAQGQAKRTAAEIDQQVILKTKELEDLKKQIDVYKAKMESLLISQLELLKEANKD